MVGESKVSQLMRKVAERPGTARVFLRYADCDPNEFVASVSWRQGHDEGIPPVSARADSPEKALRLLLLKLENDK